MAEKNMLPIAQRMKLAGWVSQNHDRLLKASAGTVVAAKEATAALGFTVTVTGNNVLGMVEFMGLAPLTNTWSSEAKANVSTELAQQLKAAGELTIDGLATVQSSLSAVRDALKALEAKVDALTDRIK